MSHEIGEPNRQQGLPSSRLPFRISMLLLAVVIGVALLSQFAPNLIKNPTLAVKIVGSAVVAGPPFWFWREWHNFSDKRKLAPFERLMADQSSARDLWLGLIGILVIWFGLED